MSGKNDGLEPPDNSTPPSGDDSVHNNRQMWADFSKRLDGLSGNLGEMAKALVTHLSDHHGEFDDDETESETEAGHGDTKRDSESESGPQSETQPRRKASPSEGTPRVRKAATRDTAPTVEHWWWKPRGKSARS